MNFAAGKKNILILTALALIFWVLYVLLAAPAATTANISPRFDWPDETANYFWITHLAAENQLVVAEPLNAIADNQVHPRSFNVTADGRLVPGSFLGLILLYGFLAKIFGSWAIIYFTPTLAIFGALAWYGIIKKIFNQKVALISAALILFQPAWWYYTEFSLLPNVAFVSLILISLSVLICPDRLTRLAVISSGLLAGLVIAIRPSEIIWLIAVYFAAAAYLRGRLKINHALLFLLAIIAVVAPVLFLQKFVYGSFLASGYSQLQSVDASCQVCVLAKNIILPFGFHPVLMLKNFWHHYIMIIWWFSVPAMFGAIIVFFQARKNRLAAGYLGLGLFVFGWLMVYYGSWEFSDQQTLALNALGASYVRYWLPSYLFCLPLVASLIVWLQSLRKKSAGLIGGLIIGGLFLLSANSVLWAAPDSLLPVKNRIAGYKAVAAEVNRLTEAESVIITVRKDKVFFPERKVIHSFDPLADNAELQSLLPGLLESVPVYYYALQPEDDLLLLNGRRLFLVKNFGSEVLYKLQ